MNDHTADSSKPGGYVYVLAAALFLFFTQSVIPSADLWWDLANGHHIWSNLAIPKRDIFSYTAYGSYWENDEWLAALLFYLVYSGFGLAGLQIMKWIMLSAAFLICIFHAQRRSGGELSIVVAGIWCILFSQYRYFFDVRPYLVTYIGLSLFWLLLYLYIGEGRDRVLMSLPFITLLWVNCHGAVLAGLVMLVIAAVTLSWERENRSKALLLWKTVAWSLLAGLINPNGYYLFTHSFRLWHSIWSRYLNEWQPLFDSGGIKEQFVPYVCFVGLSLLVMIMNRTQLYVYEKVVLVCFGLLSLTGWRHIPLFCFLAIPLWSICFTGLSPIRMSRWGKTVVVWASVLYLGLAGFGIDWASLSGEKRFFPRWAVQFIVANRLPRRLFHPYGWGGYLIFRLNAHGYKVFIDGRAVQVYPESVYYEYLKAASDPDYFSQLALKYDIDMALVFTDPSINEASTRIFRSLSGWGQIYGDELASIYIRKSASTRQLWQRFKEGKLVYPISPFIAVTRAKWYLNHGDRNRAALWSLRALALDSDYAPGHLLLGLIAVQEGHKDQAIEHLSKAVELDPYLQDAHILLAQLLYRSNPELARKELWQALTLNPKNSRVIRLWKELRK